MDNATIATLNEASQIRPLHEYLVRLYGRRVVLKAPSEAMALDVGTVMLVNHLVSLGELAEEHRRPLPTAFAWTVTLEAPDD